MIQETYDRCYEMITSDDIEMVKLGCLLFVESCHDLKFLIGIRKDLSKNGYLSVLYENDKYRRRAIMSMEDQIYQRMERTSWAHPKQLLLF